MVRTVPPLALPTLGEMDVTTISYMNWAAPVVASAESPELALLMTTVKVPLRPPDNLAVT
jgi:hypothetical protein